MNMPVFQVEVFYQGQRSGSAL